MPQHFTPSCSTFLSPNAAERHHYSLGTEWRCSRKQQLHRGRGAVSYCNSLFAFSVLSGEGYCCDPTITAVVHGVGRQRCQVLIVGPRPDLQDRLRVMQQDVRWGWANDMRSTVTAAAAAVSRNPQPQAAARAEAFLLGRPDASPLTL